MSDARVKALGGLEQPWKIPESDVARQAVPAIRGYIYQIHQTAASWIRLGGNDILYAEVAEDFAEVLRSPNRIDEILRATQVKDTRESGKVNLNSRDVIDAVRTLFRIRSNNVGRDVRLTFLTTSEIGRERKMPLPSGTAGLEAWRLAADGGDVTEIRESILRRLEPSDLRTFVEKSSPEVLRNELLASLTFSCGEGDWHSIAESNRIALMDLRDEVRSTAEMAYRAYDSVLMVLLETILSSHSRRLDRSLLIGCLERATSISIPSRVATTILSNAPVMNEGGRLELSELIKISEALLETGAPPWIALLFPDAEAAARSSLNKLADAGRLLAEINLNPVAGGERSTMMGLLSRSEKRHLIVGPPGSGKTYALWRTAKKILATGELIPLYLPAARLNTWQDVIALITSLAPNVTPAALLSDARVCLCIDGWSEFATGQYLEARQKVLRVAHNLQVIANARFVDVRDTAFKAWSLEPLAPGQVTQVLAEAYPTQPLPPQQVLELLRLPLLLSIRVLSGSKASQPGELLRQFHAHVARNAPEVFTSILADAVAELSLAGDRSYGRFISFLQAGARASGLSDPIALLQSLGTIVERAGQVLPIHDLYWSWLTGLGFLAKGKAKRAVARLHTRESYGLAIQSGACAESSDVKDILTEDLVLAVALERSLPPWAPPHLLADALDRALSDPRLSVRSRGAFAVLQAVEPPALRRALDVLSEVAKSRLNVVDWREALDPDKLFSQRGTIGDWLGADGTEMVLDVIAEKGGPEWNSWLEQVAINGKIPIVDALGVALGCSHDVPTWGENALEDLISSKAWKLAAVTARRRNAILAMRVARDYERLIELVWPGSGWIHVNRMLVACGGDDVFELLLAQFDAMDARAQELLGYAVVERGEPWVARFQRIAFSRPGGRHHHRLAEELSFEIDDDTARCWIAAGYDDVGWRVLIARHGNAVVPELLAGLPASLGGLHNIPALAHMRFLKNAPLSLVDELWGRLSSPMQPKALHDVLAALATVYPQGMASIVRYILDHPGSFPAYHVHHVMRLYSEWRKRLGADLRVKVNGNDAGPFLCWIGTCSALLRWENGSTPMMLAFDPDLAANFVLEHLKTDDEKAAAVLGHLHKLPNFNNDLFDRMLAAPSLARLVPQVFAECFNSMPIDALHRCLSCPHIDQSQLLFRLSATTNPLHRSAHTEIILRVLSDPMRPEWLAFAANMLRGYPRGEVLDILDKTSKSAEDNWLWLVRYVEIARGERLVDEIGRLRR